uniref:Splicing factor Cactin C-terminal domain-containing protein n=1 Tax=Compsopogon caeruleus TaxID=31354 RepID=A0A6T6CI31_9RHOD
MVDVEYWEVLLAKIRILICKEKLRLLQVDFFVEREERKMARNQEGVPSSIPAVRFPQPSEEGHIDDDERAGRINKIDERDDDDEAFMEEFVLETANKYSWNDKYRPRKPRYFNRVHTAYEWNKYNQTHYDHDNPPPKTVQGYKFSIFYPDLIDKTIPPSFRVQETENPDVAILRFVAGPPYEDIAFKIVNREWEHSHRKGYRSSFERGILHLWFNFKRLRYRR